MTPSGPGRPQLRRCQQRRRRQQLSTANARESASRTRRARPQSSGACYAMLWYTYTYTYTILDCTHTNQTHITYTIHTCDILHSFYTPHLYHIVLHTHILY